MTISKIETANFFFFLFGKAMLGKSQFQTYISDM